MIGLAMTSDSSKRPLSPHLQIYRWQLTMTMSILHRMTGAALCVGTLMMAWWLVAAALGEGAYYTAMDFIKSPLGIFMMFGWSFCFYYHLLNGIRHMIWDTGRMFKTRDAFASGYIVLLLAIIATAATWWEVYS